MIALITMDSIDQHWVTLNEGAQKAAEELGVTVTFMSPNTKDDAQQIECVNNAVCRRVSRPSWWPQTDPTPSPPP